MTGVNGGYHSKKDGGVLIRVAIFIVSSEKGNATVVK